MSDSIFLVAPMLGRLILVSGFIFIGGWILRRANPKWRVGFARVSMVALVATTLSSLFGTQVAMPILPPNVGATIDGTTLPSRGLFEEVVITGQDLFPEEESTLSQASAIFYGIEPFRWLTLLTSIQSMLLLWLCGVLFFLCRDLLSLVPFLVRARSGGTIPDSLLALWDSACREIGMSRKTVLLQCQEDSFAPFLFPGPKLRLIVPDKLEETFSSDQIRQMFRHEAAHIKNGDPLALPLMRLGSAILWFLPTVWWLASKHLEACEEVADMDAARMGDADEFKAALASFALHLLPTSHQVTASILRKKTLTKRLEAVERNAGTAPPSLRRMKFVLVLCLLIFAAPGFLTLAQMELESPVDPATDSASSAGDDAADLWYRSFLHIQAAEELEKNPSSQDEVLNKLSEAYLLLYELQERHPEFHPETTKMRLNMTIAKMEEIRKSLRESQETGKPRESAKESIPSTLPHVDEILKFSAAKLKPSVLQIRGVTGEWDEDLSQGRRIKLIVEMVSNGTDAIQPEDVGLIVRFYETVDDKRLEKSMVANGYDYVSAPYTWQKGETETIEVSYFLPKSFMEKENRKYYGRIVELFYRSELQDVVASPSKLLRMVE